MRRLVLLVLLIPAVAFAQWNGWQGRDPTTSRPTSMETASPTSSTVGGFVFSCPTDAELCSFIASDPADADCFTDLGWTAEIGPDATMCDNQQFNGQIDASYQIRKLDGFWTQGASDSAQLILDVEFTGTGAGTGLNTLVGIHRSNLAIICLIQADDIAATDPAPLYLFSGTGGPSVDTGFTVTDGDRFWFWLEWDHLTKVCTLRVDPISIRPGTGTLLDFTDLSSGNVVGDIIILRNFVQTNLVTVKRVIACVNGCTFESD